MTVSAEELASPALQRVLWYACDTAPRDPATYTILGVGKSPAEAVRAALLHLPAEPEPPALDAPEEAWTAYSHAYAAWRLASPRREILVYQQDHWLSRMGGRAWSRALQAFIAEGAHR